MQRVAFAIMVSALFVLVSCVKDNAPIELTILHTNDIHSHLRAASVDPFHLGGLARLKTLLDRRRAAASASVTLDAGDWSEGTWYYSIDQGANMLRLLDRLGYDAVCLGNHDFLSGPDAVWRRMQAAKPSFPVLAANLNFHGYSHAAEIRQVLPPSAIKTVAGLRIGFIGLTTFEFVYDSYFAPVKITDPVAATRAMVAELRPQVDVLILISHNSFATNRAIAEMVPGLDAVISGHSHIKTPSAVLAYNSGREIPVVETGQWGEFLGELKLRVIPGKSGAKVTFKEFHLNPVTPDLVEDPQVARMVEEEDHALNTEFSSDVHEAVSESEIDVLRSDGAESTLANLAAKAYRAETGADLALEESSLTGVGFTHGPVSLMDLHDVSPHIFNLPERKEWALNIWNASGKDIFKVINVFYTVTGLVPSRSAIGWLATDNAKITWEPGIFRSPQSGADPDRDIPAVKEIEIGEKPLQPDQHYRVALHDGLLFALETANHLLPLGIDFSEVTRLPLESWDAVARFGKKNRLSLPDLRIGGHAMTKKADLAVHYYGIQWDGQALSVEVENHGLSDSQTASLVCASGVPNGYVVFDTDAQTWKRIGQAKLAPIKAGGSAILRMPWPKRQLSPGLWPVKCSAKLAGDPYPSNDEDTRVFEVRAP